jgi:hypothetical protein
MTSLDRAKRFLASKARTLALTAVPLATLVAVAPPAKAGPVVFNTGTCSATATGSSSVSGTPSCGNSLLVTMPNGANGLHLNGNVSAISNSGGTSFGAVLDWSGAANSGSFTGSMPVTWNFTVGFTPAGIAATPIATYSWTLDFWFNTRSIHLQETGSGAVSAPFQGSDSVPFNNTFVFNWEAQLTATRTSVNSGETLSLTVPNSSVDINPAVAVPEPASLLLMTSGLGYILWRKRRRQT